MHGRVYDSSESLNPHLKVIPTEDFNRWERQIATEYEQLSDKEKESDRIEVRKYLPLVQELLTKKDQEHKAELEMIKGEILELTTYIVSADYDDYTFAVKPAIEREKALSILDKHINK